MAKSSKTHILIIEDDEALRKALKFNLREHGYNISTAADGPSGLEKALRKSPDLILLDLMLPGMDGLSLVHTLRQESSVPVLILSARTSELDKIVGLESGADDYLTKPFSIGELLARIRALLRRAQETSANQELKVADIRLDMVSRQAQVGDETIFLSPREFSLLAELMRHKGAVLSRDLLLNRVWGHNYVGDPRTVDVHIRWLREKIEQDPSNPQRICTVRGIGYRFDPPESEQEEEPDEE